LELQEGRHLLEQARHHSSGGVGTEDLLRSLDGLTSNDERLNVLLQDEVAQLMDAVGPRANETRADRDLKVWVDRPAAAFSAWYELFPRSQSGDVRRHGTFGDVITRLDYVSDLGFDVLYFPPIHPIGEVNRKGRNNSLTAEPDDPGSPYAIGSKLGGHDAIHAELGTAEDFRLLVAAARERGLEIALDFAIQCAPDHPWIKEHPEWFDWRPDGTIKFAENPPKKYEDIVNVHFYRDAFPALWHALRDVVLHWVGEGVRIFRVDNPHTKPYPFWEWLIGEVQSAHPDVIFLSEAFTRPKIMKRLAKLGFTQSYTYFTWRNTKAELTEYLGELTGTEMAEYYRPNFFTNTPDINPFFLQTSGRAGFRVRLVLASMLSGNYGIYNGFELCEAAALPGKEEYLDSEKYEIRAWDWDREGHIKDDVRLVNRLRRNHPALQQLKNLTFLNAWNDQILYFMKYTEDRQNIILCACNLDPHSGQGAHFEVPLWEFDLGDQDTVGVEDLVSGERFTWTGKVQHMWLDPDTQPYRLWRLIPPDEEPAVAGRRP
jgi:starch synthase (maltosyl-transferring)